jgi:acetoin utilization deacetylase AcuC-like enzyme
MRLSTAGFAKLTADVCAVADECCEGRVIAITEGGYDLGGLAGCLRALVSVLDSDVAGESAAADQSQRPDARRGRATIEAVLPGLRRYWQL